MSKKVTVKVDRAPKQEPVELTTDLFDEDARNDEFEATYKDKKYQTPFYKKWWFIVLVIIAVLCVLGKFLGRDSNTDEKPEIFNWSSFSLNEKQAFARIIKYATNVAALLNSRIEDRYSFMLSS